MENKITNSAMLAEIKKDYIEKEKPLNAGFWSAEAPAVSPLTAERYRRRSKCLSQSISWSRRWRFW